MHQPHRTPYSSTRCRVQFTVLTYYLLYWYSGGQRYWRLSTRVLVLPRLCIMHTVLYLHIRTSVRRMKHRAKMRSAKSKRHMKKREHQFIVNLSQFTTPTDGKMRTRKTRRRQQACSIFNDRYSNCTNFEIYEASLTMLSFRT